MQAIRLQDFSLGEHLVSSRGVYHHHALYIGDQKIIHYSGFANGFMKGKVEIDTLQNFCKNDFGSISVIPHKSPKYTSEQAIDRAYKRLNEDKYSVLFNNCEHFVNFCIEGRHSSKQVKLAFGSMLSLITIGIVSYHSYQKFIKDPSKLI